MFTQRCRGKLLQYLTKTLPAEKAKLLLAVSFFPLKGQSIPDALKRLSTHSHFDPSMAISEVRPPLCCTWNQKPRWTSDTGSFPATIMWNMLPPRGTSISPKSSPTDWRKFRTHRSGQSFPTSPTHRPDNTLILIPILPVNQDCRIRSYQSFAISVFENIDFRNWFLRVRGNCHD